MTWRLFNKLFGWDYVIYTNIWDDHIVRLRKDVTGKIYYKKPSGGYFTLIEKEIKNLIWLTCEPEKYFGEVKP